MWIGSPATRLFGFSKFQFLPLKKVAGANTHFPREHSTSECTADAGHESYSLPEALSGKSLVLGTECPLLSIAAVSVGRAGSLCRYFTDERQTPESLAHHHFVNEKRKDPGPA